MNPSEFHTLSDETVFFLPDTVFDNPKKIFEAADRIKTIDGFSNIEVTPTFITGIEMPKNAILITFEIVKPDELKIKSNISKEKISIEWQYMRDDAVTNIDQIKELSGQLLSKVLINQEKIVRIGFITTIYKTFSAEEANSAEEAKVEEIKDVILNAQLPNIDSVYHYNISLTFQIDPPIKEKRQNSVLKLLIGRPNLQETPGDALVISRDINTNQDVNIEFDTSGAIDYIVDKQRMCTKERIIESLCPTQTP